MTVIGPVVFEICSGNEVRVEISHTSEPKVGQSWYTPRDNSPVFGVTLVSEYDTRKEYITRFKGKLLSCKIWILLGTSIPYHTIPYRTVPYRTVPYRTVPYRTVPYRTVPYRTVPYRTIPYHTIPYHTRPDHTRPDQTRPDQTRPDQTRPDQTVRDQELIKFIAPEFVSCLGEGGVPCVRNAQHFCKTVLMNKSNIMFEVAIG